MDNTDFDELNLGQEKNIKAKLESHEQILLSCTVYKFNDYKRRQERNIMISSKFVYNLKGKNIKRKIDLQGIKAVTVGTYGSEFVIHVPGEYDYRYQSSDKRERILITLTQAVVYLTQQKLAFFFKDDVCLYKYATTKQDKKKGVVRMPTDDVKMMDAQILLELFEGQSKQNQEMKEKTSTLWAKEKGKVVTVEDFTNLKVLGQGAFGKVLLVEEKKTKEWFAMKVIKKEIIIKKAQLEHTKTEKMVLEHVNHPFLVNLVYAFQDPFNLFFVMQFMKGGELFQHLRMSKKFEEKRARFYVCQLALGLGHLHSKNIIYRDLKLENILMDELGNVYLTDFGMAKILKGNDLAMTFCGTPEYLCPELIRGEGCDRTADWWSLGILAYEMMYGIPPFYNKNQPIMFKMIKENELRFPEKVEVSKEGKDFILHCLNRDRTQRLGAKDDVKEILSHPWFVSLNIEQMLQKKIPPPFTPKVTDEQWVEYFDKDYIDLKPKVGSGTELDDQTQQKLAEINKDVFQDF